MSPRLRTALGFLALAFWTALLLRFGTGCAFGNADWRRESHDVRVTLPGAGDGRCSDPAPWQSFEACLAHDAAYSVARCDERYDSEQARFTADAELLATLAGDGYGEFWATIYYLSVRLAGWSYWHLGACERTGAAPAP